MKITNNTDATINFRQKGLPRDKNGEVKTVSVGPKATADVDVDPNDAQLRAHVFAKAVTVSDSVAEKIVEAKK